MNGIATHRRRVLRLVAATAGTGVMPAFALTPRRQRYKPIQVTTPDAVRISVQDWNLGTKTRRPELLFIHSTGQCHLAWNQQVDSEFASAFRIVTYDLRGHGESDKPSTPDHYSDPRRWADELRAVIEQAELDRPVIVAWGFGGKVLLDYLVAHGDERVSAAHFVAALTNDALNSRSPFGGLFSPSITPLDAHIKGIQGRLRSQFSRQPATWEFEAMVAYNMLVPQIALNAMAVERPGFDTVLKNLARPTLVTHGDEDKVVAPAVGRYTANMVPGARLSLHAGIGHWPFWEDDRRFNRELAEFTRQAWRP